MKHENYFKAVVAFALVLAIAILSWLASPVMLSYGQGYGYGGGGGGGGGGGLMPITATGSLNLTPYLDIFAKTIVEISLSSSDGQVTIVIPSGTRMLDAEGNPLETITIEMLMTPPPPPGYALVGPAYDAGPDGATFTPAIGLLFSYDPADIPAGVSEEDLTLAYWDGDEWVMMPTTVNTLANTVTTDVAHFTPFAILAELPPAPAAFAVSSLFISPTEADIGQTVTINVLVSNTGEVTGSYEVTLKVDEVVTATEEVTLAGGATQEVTFTTAKSVAGTYTVDVDGLVGEFVVRAAPPPPTVPPPVPPPVPPEVLPINWWLIGGIIALVVGIGGVLWYLLIVRRGRA